MRIGFAPIGKFVWLKVLNLSVVLSLGILLRGGRAGLVGLLVFEAQFVPSGGLHKLMTHATVKVVSGLLSANGVLIVVATQTTHIQNIVFLAEMLVVQREAAFVGRSGYKSLLVEGVGGHCTPRPLF